MGPWTILPRCTIWWESRERMLGEDISKFTWEQFRENFYAKFFSATRKDAKHQKFQKMEQGSMTVEQDNQEFGILARFAPELVKAEVDRANYFVRGFKLELQGFVLAFRPATQADALRLAVDMSMYERVDLAKDLKKKSTLGLKRKAEQQPTIAP